MPEHKSHRRLTWNRLPACRRILRQLPLVIVAIALLASLPLAADASVLQPDSPLDIHQLLAELDSPSSSSSGDSDPAAHEQTPSPEDQSVRDWAMSTHTGSGTSTSGPSTTSGAGGSATSAILVGTLSEIVADPPVSRVALESRLQMPDPQPDGIFHPPRRSCRLQ